MEEQLIIAIIAGCAAALAGGAGVFAYLKKKGIHPEKAMDLADRVTTVLNGGMTALKPFLPDTPIVDSLSWLFKTAEEVTKKTEELYKMGEIGKDERNAKAKEFIYNILEDLGVQRCERIDAMVNGAVEAAAALLPKTHDQNGNIIR